MPLDEVFVDASALVALVNSADGLHRQAVSLHQDLKKKEHRRVTSDGVLSEFLAGTSYPVLRNSAAELVEAFRTSARTTVLPGTREEWDRAFGLYRSHRDKRWSLIDCSSMLACQDRGITKVFTSDRHFLQFGLEILLDVQTS